MVATYRNDLKCTFRELNYIRRFTVDQMIREIEFLLENYRRIKMFIFDDDLFTFDKSYVKEFCRAMPWFVNPHSDLPAADFYGRKVDKIMSMDQEQWSRAAPDVHRQDSEISKHLSHEGLSHYAIKYNPFMGVMSDYFLHED